ncbi:TetR/AcrR family transcriptional regulator [Nonomuraea sp. CA-141351]|uniref:TetR/AcrR family transcriptional regulator n=1 Tax=Nonomuraea sp. CA-141351 TaxID=3239996 RepID=UPI003D90BA06
MGSPEGGEQAAILRAATRLFAALGYDGTAIEQIAEAAGVDAAAVGTHFASKRRLYLTVMEEAHRALAAVLDARAGELRAAPPERRAEALHRLIDGYIDLCAENPEIPALWMHRWLSDASDIDLEPLNAQALTQRSIDSIDTLAKPAGADGQFITYTMIWCIHGFAMSGVLDGTGQRRHAGDPRTLRRFRAHMHQLIARGLQLPDSDPRQGP